VLIHNTGDGSGSYTATLKINGVVEATKEVTLNAGASEEVVFTTAKNVAGGYSVEIDGISGSFAVKEKPAPPPPPPSAPEAPTAPTPSPALEIKWPLILGIAGGVVVVGLIILFVIRRRRA
jgi:hypothetical protein